jgi:hypothetical protein
MSEIDPKQDEHRIQERQREPIRMPARDRQSGLGRMQNR